MKNIFFSAFFFLCLTKIVAQELSIDKIWKKYEFSSKGIAGFKSMNNGTHYTKPGNDLSILKYDILDDSDLGKTLVDSKNLVYNSKMLEYDDYEFNSDETKILFLIGTLEAQCRNFSKSINFLKKAYKLNPNSWEISSNLGNVYTEINEFKNAIKYSSNFERNLVSF